MRGGGWGGHRNPHGQGQPCAAPSAPDLLHACSLALLQQGAFPGTPWCTGRTPVSQFTPSSTQPNSRTVLVTMKDLHSQRQWKAAGSEYPHQECPPFPQSSSTLGRGRTGGVSVFVCAATFLHANTAFHGFVPSTLSICILLALSLRCRPLLFLPSFPGLFPFLLHLHAPP